MSVLKEHNSRFKLHKIINGVEVQFIHSFLTDLEAKKYIEDNYEKGGLVTHIEKSRGRYILYDVYVEVEPPLN